VHAAGNFAARFRYLFSSQLPAVMCLSQPALFYLLLRRYGWCLCLFGFGLSLITANAQAPRQLSSPDQAPKGLAKSDWTSIRAAYEAGRHQFVKQEDGSHVARPFLKTLNSQSEASR
jgi:hypothetical protein